MRLEELDVALVGRAAVARNGVLRSLNHPQSHLGKVAGIHAEKIPLDHREGHSGLQQLNEPASREGLVKEEVWPRMEYKFEP